MGIGKFLCKWFGHRWSLYHEDPASNLDAYQCVRCKSFIVGAPLYLSMNPALPQKPQHRQSTHKP